MNAQTKIETPAVPAVYGAIADVMAAVSKEGLSKDRRNQQQGYQFRGIDDVYNLLCGILAENRLVILPDVEKMEREERQTQKGGTITYTILTVRFKLVSAVDGSFDYVRTVGEAMDSADKSANKAQSAAMKYAELQLFQIPTEGDNDADSTTHEVAGGNSARKGAQEDIAPQGMPDAEWAKLGALLKATGIQPGALIKKYGVENLRLLNQQQYGNAIEGLTKLLAGKAKAETDAKAKEQGGQQSNDFGDMLDDEIPF